MSDSFQPLAKCLACDESALQPVLDLGAQPLANTYHRAGETLPSFPLGVNLCQKCFHVQQFVAVNPDLMFKDYLYVSGTSATLRDYFEWFANMVSERVKGGKRVLDIACNDGSQLAPFIKRGWEAFGVDPAENLLERSRATGATILCDYWNAASAAKIGGLFDVLIAQNVFAHVADAFGFLQACKSVMNESSRLFIQTSQADMVAQGQFDTIYHEHISFFSARSMRTLAERAGFRVEDIFITPVHGGSYVFVLAVGAPSDIVTGREQAEEKEGRYEEAFYQKFARDVRTIVSDLKTSLEGLRAEGRKLIGYGAAAKGNTLLNFAQIRLDYIVDDNPLKQNLLTPGMDIEIRAREALAGEKEPIALIPLAWNFFDEISRNVKALRPNSGDVFVTYFPKVEVRR